MNDVSRAMAAVERAWEIVDESGFRGTTDALPEQVLILEDVLARPLPVDVHFTAASALVDARHIQAAAHGVFEGYAVALDRLGELVDACAARYPEARVKYLMSRADYHLLRIDELDPFDDSHLFHDDGELRFFNGPPPPYYAAEAAEIERYLRQADAAAPQDSVLRFRIAVRLALLMAEHQHDRNGAIEQLSGALATYDDHQVERDGAVSTLASLLQQRGATAGANGLSDLHRAASLCTDLLRRRVLPAAQAARTLAHTLIALDGLGVKPHPSTWPRSPGAAFRLAVAEASRFTVIAPSRPASDWVRWATERQDVDEAAEAYWQLVTSLPREIAVLLTAPAQRRAMQRQQSLAAEAGYWLVRAKRFRDAAVAMELARAIALSERSLRMTGPDVVRLREQDPGLYSSYRRAAEALDAAQREELEQPTGSDLRTGVTAAHQAWSDYERVMSSVREALVFAPVVESFDYDALLAAAEDGILAYVGAADAAGFAVLVDADAAEPIVLEFQDLTSEALDEQIERLAIVASADPHRAAAPLAAVVDWCGPIVEDLVAAAGHRPLSVLPLGVLGLLPLHAAAAERGRSIRYAPNARLLAANRVARAGPGLPTVVAVDAPDPYLTTLAPLRLAPIEAEAVAALYGERARRVREARVADVLAEVATADIWHLACHGQANAADALDSALLLTDGPLSLRALLARSGGRHRLAVLSACETHVPDSTQFDEVMSLPSALLQAGVAGVVATSWHVDDRAAMCLVWRLHQRLVDGAHPSDALLEAQLWLRDVTNRDLADCLPAVVDASEVPASLRDAWASTRPFNSLAHWAAFSFTGT